jgi:hypothetical protein
MTVGFSFTYSVLTSMPIKKAKLKSRKGKSPQGLVLLIMMLLLVSKRSFLAGFKCTDANCFSFGFQERVRKVSRLWMVTGVCGPWRCVAQVRRDEGNKTRKA